MRRNRRDIDSLFTHPSVKVRCRSRPGVAENATEGVSTIPRRDRAALRRFVGVRSDWVARRRQASALPADWGSSGQWVDADPMSSVYPCATCRAGSSETTASRVAVSLRIGSRRAMQTLDKIIRWAFSTTPISVDERYQTDQAAGSGKSKRYDATTPGDRFDWRRPLKLSRVLGVAGKRRVGERRQETAWGLRDRQG